jgi:hypothetical protein
MGRNTADGMDEAPGFFVAKARTHC